MSPNAVGAESGFSSSDLGGDDAGGDFDALLHTTERSGLDSVRLGELRKGKELVSWRGLMENDSFSELVLKDVFSAGNPSFWK